MRYSSRSFVNARATVILITSLFTGCWMLHLIYSEQYSEQAESFKFSLQQFLPDDITCYFEDDIEDEYWRRFSRKFTSTDVYFHWTSCGATMKLAHLCAIEAATRAYPHEKVYVLFLKPLQFNLAQKKLLSKFLLYMESVKFVRILANEYFNLTPFEKTTLSFLNSSLIKKHKELEEIMKLSTLYQHGGIVIDTDVIVTEIPDIPENFLVRENNTGMLSSAMLSFKIDAASFITAISMSGDTLRNYNLSSRLTYQYNKCTKGLCEDIKILRNNIVDVKYTDKAGAIPPAFAYRIIDKLFQRRFPDNSLLGVIAKKYCPFVYSHSYLFQ